MTKAKSFTVKFDRKRSDAMNVLVNLALNSVDQFSENPTFKENIGEICKLVDEFSDKTHTLGWCNDEHCPLKDIKH